MSVTHYTKVKEELEMSGFTFATVEKPVQRRIENPFVEAVQSIAGTDKALSFEMPAKTDADKKLLERAKRQLTDAGNEITPEPVTVRRDITEKSGVAKITFWTVPKIKHNASGDDSE